MSTKEELKVQRTMLMKMIRRIETQQLQSSEMVVDMLWQEIVHLEEQIMTQISIEENS